MNLKDSSLPKVSSGIIWINASRSQVSQLMNPDNLFSDPMLKMQFLDLHYQEIKVEDLDVLLDGKGVLSGMGEVFLKASKENNINPVYLVAHALHESNDGRSKLSRYNNFFGLGAVDGQAEKMGIKFAKEHDWTTPERGILGAAKIISKQWINKMDGAQNTLYAMRWNPMSPGIGQYATDIGWANKQTKFIYKQMIKMDRIDSSYQPHFIIPKYRF